MLHNPVCKDAFPEIQPKLTPCLCVLRSPTDVTGGCFSKETSARRQERKQLMPPPLLPSCVPPQDPHSFLFAAPLGSSQAADAAEALAPHGRHLLLVLPDRSLQGRAEFPPPQPEPQLPCRRTEELRAGTRSTRSPGCRRHGRTRPSPPPRLPSPLGSRILTLSA